MWNAFVARYHYFGYKTLVGVQMRYAVHDRDGGPIAIPNLGSHILAIVRRRLPADWTERYNTTPVLIETFVETPRHTGAVYRASGWIHVGTTQGRGRYDRQKQYDKPRKDIWLRPLRRNWSRTLNR